jgi:predicted regulator of Ras-like GTPase activity (Roadblock/LC7/MglB family)
MPLSGLIKASPPGIFDASLADCQCLVELPLSEILSRLKANHLTRRPNQKRVLVSADITPIFGAKGQLLVPLFSSTAPENKVLTSAQASSPASSALAPAPSIRQTRHPELTLASPVALTAPQPSTPAGRSAIPGKPAHPAPRPISPMSRASLTPPETTPHAPAQPPGKNGVIKAPLEALSENWPESVRQEIAQRNLAQCVVVLPIHEIEPALKRGKVMVTWKQIRSWLGPSAAGSFVSTHDDVALELQLSTIVPLFLAQLKTTNTRRLVSVAPSIPNLFFVGHTPTPAPSSTQPRVADTVPARDKGAVPEARSVLPDLGQIFGQPEKRHWTPVEIVQQTNRLSGVAGVVIALQDGLLVASELPPEFNADAFAAFLPQMHGRVAQCTREINLGEPTRLSLLLDQVPLLIVKAGRVFLAVLGRAGQDLPELTLTAIAAQLKRPSK